MNLVFYSFAQTRVDIKGEMDCAALCTTAAVVEEYCLFGWEAVWTGRNLPAIRRKILPPF
jgi:hypothetical protein